MLFEARSPGKELKQINADKINHLKSATIIRTNLISVSVKYKRPQTRGLSQNQIYY